MQTKVPAGVDVNEVGRVMATLDDWRTIVYVLIVVIVIMVAERATSAWGMRAERKLMVGERERMWTVADKFGEAAKDISEQTTKLVVELQVLRAMIPPKQVS